MLDVPPVGLETPPLGISSKIRIPSVLTAQRFQDDNNSEDQSTLKLSTEPGKP